MRRLLGSISILSAFAATAVAQAAPSEQNFMVRTTGDLAELCSDTSPTDPMMTAAVNFCQGYIVGVYHVLTEVEQARTPKPAFCLPNPPPTRNQAIAEFVKWAKASPNDSALPAADGVFKFFEVRFPCGTKP